jgi:hypothetical protein
MIDPRRIAQIAQTHPLRPRLVAIAQDMRREARGLDDIVKCGAEIGVALGGAVHGEISGKEGCSFLKKRTKKLLI